MKYSQIKDLGSLDAALRELTGQLEDKGREISEDLGSLRDACTPSNILAAGIRSVSSALPLDRLALWAIRRIKSRL